MMLSVEDEGVDHMTLCPALLREGEIVLKDLAHVGDANLFGAGELGAC